MYSLPEAHLIANYCNQLSELELRSNHWNHEYLDIILPKVGQMLRKLTLLFELSRDETRVTRNNCPNINSSNLSCTRAENDAMASIFCSYGENLHEADLPTSFSVSNIRTVLSSCPNLTFTARVHAYYHALGDHVVELLIELHEGHFTPRQAQEIFSRCTVLRKLTIDASPFSSVKSVWRDQTFDYPFINPSCIRSLRIDYLLTPFNLMFIANNFSLLDHTFVRVGTEGFDAGLEQLIENNKMLLSVNVGLPITYRGTNEDPDLED